MQATEYLNHKFPYRWNLSDGYPAKGIEPNGCKVFGTFICGGGSTMGYKLAGYDHLGGVEIDPKVANVYKENHNPKYLYVEDIRRFNERNDLPLELYNLDLLDGSPPCSSFSMAGNREKDWGKQKQFREGQEFQRLDDLVFEYVRTIKKLQPKVALLENVKGLITGNAKAYAKEIKSAFEAAGYRVQVFLLNAASMGVPQKRERVFFIGQREDMNFVPLKLEFNEPPISFKESTFDFWGIHENNLNNNCLAKEYPLLKQGESSKKYFQLTRIKENEPSPTITTGCSSSSTASIVHPIYARKFNKNECCIIGTYPIDYNFDNIKPAYLIGMSVPPVMTAQIAHQIYLQWLQ